MTKLTPVTIAVGLLISGCSMSHKSASRIEFGPPPIGDPRIVGGAVPDWKPARQRVGAESEGENPLSWVALGPRPIESEFWSGNKNASGRCVSIATHPTDLRIAYVASASGGLWKTASSGLFWEPLTDGLSVLNHGCVVLDPSNPDVIYLGTGEYTVQSTGDGLFRSIDAGQSFERIGTVQQVGFQCSKIAIDPTNPNVIHLTGTKGYVRSIDDGATWTNPMTGSCSDMALNPENPSIVYVARHFDGIYRSTNGGTTFTKLTNGLPTSGVNRIVMSMAASNPGVLYAAIINGSAGLLGLYKTIDGGDSWFRLNNTPDFPSPQGWYDCFVGVDPTDENIVFCGGVFPTYANNGIIRSLDGGISWEDITFGGDGNRVHPDQHTIAFGPTGWIWVGNDGGMWRSFNGGDTWINLNLNLTVTQNYAIAVHPTDFRHLIAGTQDNGTISREADSLGWPQKVPGDGGFAAYDFELPSRRYGSGQNLSVYRILGSDYQSITGPWSNDPRNFVSPLVTDPSSSTTLLAGTNRVWRTTTAPTSAFWQPISPTTVAGGGTLNAIAVGPSDDGEPSNHIYTGASSGRVYYTSDSIEWQDRTAGLAQASISDIMASPFDPQVAYVSQYRSTGGRIFRTDNAGLNWVSVSGTLPAGVTPNALAVDWDFTPDGLYVGSGAGVWVSLDQGVTWIKNGADLPNVNIGDLVINPTRREITAGTYGRGAWRATLPTVCLGGVPDCNSNGVADSCDIDDGTSPDCNNNFVPDECDLADCPQDPACADCNANGVLDGCDLTSGTSPDVNKTGVPDECESCQTVAECADDSVCTFDACQDGVCFNSIGLHGDVATFGGLCGPDGNVDIFDIFAVLDAFVDVYQPPCTAANFDITSIGVPCQHDGDVNIADIFAVLDAFQDRPACCNH